MLYEGQGSLTIYGQAHLRFNFNYYKPFLHYAFNIGGLIFRAWSSSGGMVGWPIIRTAPRCYSFFLPPLGYVRRDVT